MEMVFLNYLSITGIRFREKVVAKNARHFRYLTAHPLGHITDPNPDPEHLDVKPKNGVKWLNKSIQDIEEEYSELVNPK